MKEEIGKRINQLRKQHRLTLDEFGDIIDVGKQQVSAIESGKSGLSIEYAHIISEKFNVSLDWIIRGWDTENNPVKVQDSEFKTKYYEALEKIIALQEELNSYKKIAL